MAILSALERANLVAESVETPRRALEMLAANSFDLIFLDISMPEMSGFEVCQKLRRLRAHGKTPVIFVTSQSDFASRSQSKLIGGSDFIAKPFLFAELTVKALTYAFKHRLLFTSASIDQRSHANLEEEGFSEHSQSACLGSPLNDLAISSFPTQDSNLCRAQENTSAQASREAWAKPRTDAVGAANEISQTSVNSGVAKTPGIPESQQPNAIDASELRGKPIVECEIASSTNYRAMLDREADAGQELDRRCDELSRICDGLRKDRDKYQKWSEALKEAVNRLEAVLGEKASELEDVRSECQGERAQRKLLEAQLAEVSLSQLRVKGELNNRQEVPNDSRAASESQRSSNEGTR
jgi:CheY-like chemotaxis protein